jgi:hypothetical protein
MQMKLALILLLPIPAIAETYLCVPEAGAYVENGGPRGIAAAVVDQFSEKYVLSDESGRWLLKELGKDAPMFDSCVSAYTCENSGKWYAGRFARDPKDGVFTIHFMRIVDDKRLLDVVAKGRCTKLK